MSNGGRAPSHNRLRRLGEALLLAAALWRTLDVGLRIVDEIVGGSTASAAGGVLEFTIFVTPLWPALILTRRWPSIGAVLLLLNGEALAVILALRALNFYLPASELLTTVVGAVLAPIVAGLLFMASARKDGSQSVRSP